MGEEIPPDWAIEKALVISDYRSSLVEVKSRRTLFYSNILALARYIAEHEDEQVDPLLLEARKLISLEHPGSQTQIMRGEWDYGFPMHYCLAALKRGMELAGGKPS